MLVEIPPASKNVKIHVCLPDRPDNTRLRRYPKGTNRATFATMSNRTDGWLYNGIHLTLSQCAWPTKFSTGKTVKPRMTMFHVAQSIHHINPSTPNGQANNNDLILHRGSAVFNARPYEYPPSVLRRCSEQTAEFGTLVDRTRELVVALIVLSNRAAPPYPARNETITSWPR